MSPQPAEVDALVAAQRRERARRRRWMLACRLGALGFAGWYLWLLIVAGRDDVFYISVSLFGIATGLSGFVVDAYYDPPLLVRNLHRPDDRLRRASWAALERLREELLIPLIRDLGVRADQYDAVVAGIDADDLARRTAPKLARDRRRFGRIYLAVYVPVALAFITFIATR
jgi:hypothetical protein